MAINGKTMKGSHNRAKGLRTMHLVSVCLSDWRIDADAGRPLDKINAFDKPSYKNEPRNDE